MDARTASDSSGQQRGFALFVGMSESKARDSGVELEAVVEALKSELTHRLPQAESHALAVIAPAGDSPRDLEVVMKAFGERAPERAVSATWPDAADDIGVVIDLDRNRVLVENRDAHLTFKEFELLQVLVRNEGRTLTREQLRRVTATSDETDINDRTIDVVIRRMRAKFGAYPDVIRTVHGQGYRFDRRGDVTVLASATGSSFDV